ncbi:MAG: hypothetical protein WCH43_07545, partial [Verrucomicrobiota bacterium]
INGLGATYYPTWVWNAFPSDVDTNFPRIWDWRYPQFLAGWIEPPLPAEFPAMPGRIDFSSDTDQRFLPRGWGVAIPNARWSDGRRAEVVFAMDSITPLELQIKLRPFIVPPKLKEQRLILSINGHPLQTFQLDRDELSTLSVPVPSQYLRNKNELVFDLPNATKPSSLFRCDDPRRLGICVESMEFHPSNKIRDLQPGDDRDPAHWQHYR